jgi:DegV family protein with EDD domain
MRIVMDDSGDIPADLIEKYNIYIVPVNIMFGTEEFLSGVTMDHAAFYEKVKTVGAHNFPKTSQPTPYQFVEAYKEILATGEKDIYTVTVSGKLSGTYASAEAARQELAGQGNFHLFDSQAGSAGIGYLALEAARMAEAGASAEEITRRLKKMRDNMSIVFVIDNLEFAVKGGRVSGLQATFANLLSIKPIMTLQEGLIVPAGKVRTYKKALNHIVEAIKEKTGGRPIKLAVIHAGVPEAAEALLVQAKQSLNATETMVADIAISVAVNMGPGALGIVAIIEE